MRLVRILCWNISPSACVSPRRPVELLFVVCRRCHLTLEGEERQQAIDEQRRRRLQVATANRERAEREEK